MAYREVRMIDIDQVIRRWLAGEKIRAIARSTGSDRNTVRRIVRLAQEAGIAPGTPWPDEDKLRALRERMGRPGATVAAGQIEQQLRSRAEQIRAWLDKDHLLLTKVHELLGREGLGVSYSALYRFARSGAALEGPPRLPCGGPRVSRAKWRKPTSVGSACCRSSAVADRAWFRASS